MNYHNVITIEPGKRGNCPTKQIEIILRNQAAQIEVLLKDPEAVFLFLL